jgi:MFS family permease
MTLPGFGAHPPDDHPDRWRMLGILALAELLGMSLWFAGTAAAPELTVRWQLTSSEVGWLATAVQIGFVVGTALSALLNLADIVPARLLFAVSATVGALANGGLAFSDSFGGALMSRFLAGACLAGVYPPAMKMAATWFRERRGLAVGAVVGALTVGKAGPYLLAAWPGATVGFITTAASLSALLAGLIVWVGYREGPWIPAFVAASLVAQDPAAAKSPEASLLAFGIIAVGGVGCIWGGLVADRIGRERLVTVAMAISGSCALLVGLTFGRSLWLLAPVALAWGFFVIADSAQFSVLVAESVPPHAAGTAITLQTSLGFLLTTLTIQLVPLLVDRFGWPWAFPALAVGPALGIWAIRKLGTVGR